MFHGVDATHLKCQEWPVLKCTAHKNSKFPNPLIMLIEKSIYLLDIQCTEIEVDCFQNKKTALDLQQVSIRQAQGVQKAKQLQPLQTTRPTRLK